MGRELLAWDCGEPLHLTKRKLLGQEPDTSWRDTLAGSASG